MFFEVRFGDRPNLITGATISPDEQILDVGLQAATLTLVLRCVGMEVTGPTPTMTVYLETTLDLREGKWFSLGAFSSLSGPDEYDLRDFTGVLRYVRWNVKTLADASVASFTLYGVAR